MAGNSRGGGGGNDDDDNDDDGAHNKLPRSYGLGHINVCLYLDETK